MFRWVDLVTIFEMYSNHNWRQESRYIHISVSKAL